MIDTGVMDQDRDLQVRARIVTEQLLQRLALRVPALLCNAKYGGKIIIHFAPGGSNLRIEWPAQLEEINSRTVDPPAR